MVKASRSTRTWTAGHLYNLVAAYRVRVAVEGPISRSLLLELIRQVTEAPAFLPVQQVRAASRWPLDDHVAAVAAQEFYRRLPDTTTAEHAATALREVTCHLRDRYPDRPELWASLIHTGP